MQIKRRVKKKKRRLKKWRQSKPRANIVKYHVWVTCVCVFFFLAVSYNKKLPAETLNQVGFTQTTPETSLAGIKCPGNETKWKQ